MSELDPHINKDLSIEQELEYIDGIEGPNRIHYFNNFYLHLPMHDDRDKSYYRFLITQLNVWDTKNRDIPWRDHKLHSAIFLSQTPREFYGRVDQTLEELGITEDQITEQRKAINGTRSPETKDQLLRRHYEEVVIPAYVAMRRLGYNRIELIQ